MKHMSFYRAISIFPYYKHSSMALQRIYAAEKHLVSLHYTLTDTSCSRWSSRQRYAFSALCIIRTAPQWPCLTAMQHVKWSFPDVRYREWAVEIRVRLNCHSVRSNKCACSKIRSNQ